MSDQDKELEEPEFKLETSKDAKTVTLTIISPDIIDTHTYIVLLEEYLQDLIKAYSKMPEDERGLH